MEAEENDKKSGAREALLKSAEELFTLKGYAAVSTRELAERAGVNLGAIKYYFGSKAELFIETVRSLMNRRKNVNSLLAQPAELLSTGSAIREFILLVQAMLAETRNPQRSNVCRLMYREIHGATSQDPELYEPLLDSVVEDFFRPFDTRLRTVLKALAPQKSESEIGYISESVIGQCAVYITHRPFLERLRGVDFCSSDYLNDIDKLVVQFTLSALDVPSELITDAFCQSEMKEAV